MIDWQLRILAACARRARFVILSAQPAPLCHGAVDGTGPLTLYGGRPGGGTRRAANRRPRDRRGTREARVRRQSEVRTGARPVLYSGAVPQVEEVT